MIVEAGDWDGSMGTNTPGQSGDVNSPHYRDLFELWKDDRYFPVKFSRTAVEGVIEGRRVFLPAGRALTPQGRGRRASAEDRRP